MNADGTAALSLAARVTAEHLWHACCQGGLVLALVWGVSRWCPHCSPGVRCWLWRLAYLKLLLALAWGGASVGLPVLPSAQATYVPHPPTGTASQTDRVFLAAPEGWMVGAASSGSAGVPAHGTGDETSSGEARSWHLPLGAVAALLLSWLLGVSWRVARTARQWRASRWLVQRGVRVGEGPLFQELARLCERFALRRAPWLGLSAEVGAPMLVGAARPAILLPLPTVEACTSSELRLVVAHELAHLKRRDLLWAWLPAVAGGLFFFHPLVWLAGRDWRLAQEMACDELAVRVSEAPALEYGNMVLKIASQRRATVHGEPAVASAAGAYENLRRRLSAIPEIRSRSPRRRKLVSALLLAAGIVVTLPWRATARADEPRTQSLAVQQHQAEEPEELRQQATRTHRQHLAKEERQRRREAQAHDRRLAQQEWLRRQEALAHEHRLLELEHLRRLAMLEHERRLAEQEHLLRLAAEAHDHRLAEQEQMRRLAVRAHEQREAAVDEQRLMEKLAHERRLAQQEHVRRMTALADRQQQAARPDVRSPAEQLLRHRRRTQLMRQQLEQHDRQMAATQAAMASLALQLHEL